MHYLAAPYSNIKDKDRLMSDLCKIDALLMNESIFTVSPLLKHYVSVQEDLPGDWDFWCRYGLELLDRCDSMIVVMIPGWEKSIGVLEEIRFCKERKPSPIPIVYFDPEKQTFV